MRKSSKKYDTIVYHHHHSPARGLFELRQEKWARPVWGLGARRDLAQVKIPHHMCVMFVIITLYFCCTGTTDHSISINFNITSSASPKTLPQRSEPSRQTHFPSTSLQCTLDINFLPPDTELKARTEPPHNLLCELNSCEGGLLRVLLHWHRMTNRETLCEGRSRVLLAWMTKS